MNIPRILLIHSWHAPVDVGGAVMKDASQGKEDYVGEYHFLEGPSFGIVALLLNRFRSPSILLNSVVVEVVRLAEVVLEIHFIVRGIRTSAVVADIGERRVIAAKLVVIFGYRFVIFDQKPVFLGGGGSLLVRDGIRARHPILVPFGDGGVTHAP